MQTFIPKESSMEFGIVGLGRMGGNMARRLARKGAQIALFNRSFDVTQSLAEETGHLACDSLQALVDTLATPRIVWLMLPAGDATEATLQALRPMLAPAADRGWLHCGSAGSGHFVKMVHNGIEYGMMQALAEGFALMKNKPGFELNLGEIAGLWRAGRVGQSWLLDLSAGFVAQDQSLENIQPYVGDSADGRLTAPSALE